MRVLVRCDASVQIGSGHVMRCMTLANELKNNGAEVIFLSASVEGNLNKYVNGNGFKVIELYANDNQKGSENKFNYPNIQFNSEQYFDVRNSVNAIKRVKNIDWLIVDHYKLSKKWESELRYYVGKIMVIDDLANREHDCDILLDQNFFKDMRNRYQGLIPESCTKLFGPDYSLLRTEFHLAKKKKSSYFNKIRRIFIFFGGSDSHNLTSFVLQAIQKGGFSDFEFDVVIGENNPNIDIIETIITNMSNVNFYIQIDNISEFMSRADLSIGAGGSTIWERCYMGLPSMVITVAENQIECVKHLSEIGIIDYHCHFDNIKVNSFLKALIELCNNQNKLKLLSDRSMDMVDGLGSKRVYEKLKSYD
jgi:UDP-2,4-diacetamido-2,4,6-trideoxy-beta-L-altropyranose hydrolase